MERIASPAPLNRHIDAPPLSPSLDISSHVDLIPPPLFSKRTRRQLNATPTNIEIPHLPLPVYSAYPPSPGSTKSTTSTTSTRSTRSSSSRVFSSPASSVSSSPTRSTFSQPLSPMPIYWVEIRFDPVPQHNLKRKLSPKNETLRTLRAKESEACLQKKYEEQTCAYLNGMLFGSVQRRSRLRMVED